MPLLPSLARTLAYPIQPLGSCGVILGEEKNGLTEERAHNEQSLPAAPLPSFSPDATLRPGLPNEAAKSEYRAGWAFWPVPLSMR
jgi:hypothetical protein